MSGILRSIMALAIVVLAFLAVLVVFDVIALDALGRYAAKIVLVACVLALASVALTFLFRSRQP